MTNSNNDLDLALHRSVLKREAVKEKEFAEEKARREAEFLAQVGTTEMTEKELRKIVDGDRRMYYRTLELNDKLYIHYKGWRKIQNLEGWTGLRALYAECNAFSKIEGLQACRNLRSLFLQENCIHKIEGLENCPELWSLNLSNNFIERIEGLSHLRRLNTLTIAKNKIGLGGIDDLAHLAETTINSLDVQGNRIDDPDVVPEALMRMPELRVLYLKDNPCTKKIVNYRKGITAYCKNLRYLDDRPVFEEDRRAAEAFNRGGIEEERAERRRIRQEKDDAHQRNMEAFQEMIHRARQEKWERDQMRKEDKYTDETDPVESPEKRFRRLNAEWQKEHEDELKDDAKEYAERCLKAERERGSQEVEEPEEEAPSKPQVHQEEKVESDPSKVDNRKLVYEDVWDDLPTSGVAVPAVPSPARAQQQWIGEEHMPVQSRGGASASSGKKLTVWEEPARPSGGENWYDAYRRKVFETEVALEAPGRTGPSTPPEASEVGEWDDSLPERPAAEPAPAEAAKEVFGFRPPPRSAASNESQGPKAASEAAIPAKPAAGGQKEESSELLEMD
mmetsp:Transcript_26531/g.61934  ORF Transcript_26531/g.61934 Transcript_26531/m.61934 type:complete len:562 (-) Transcript_26531:116-1801(-)|eukprot:CAMPEP_0178409440 /NCGR_PEP_ID=MMETSP0689_2-20121128/20464_1 /TAXON_ID=160604 /ORGANISM="Amphidinium massartii, Strain CS-259" /LENGTH=561 /DNA_ID=CAMNT_0020030583 /DNA_START=75 /DNA_END=1760 /DNA_ORIENTATION=-